MIVYVAPFAMTGLLVVVAIDWIRSHRLNRRFLLAILLLGCTYAAVEYQLINSVFAPQTWVSHRTEWNRWTDLSVSSNIRRTLELGLTTQYHTGSFSTLPAILATGAAFVLLIAKKRRAGVLDVVAVAIAVVCLEYGFYDWIVFVCGRLVPTLKYFNAGRFYFLLPLLWFVLFAMSLKELRRVRWGWVVVWCLIASQAYVIMKLNTECKNNIKLLIGRPIAQPTFKEFFSQKIFDEIDAFIGRPKDSYRVVSIGMHPSVAQFNGFYTLDSYTNSYPLSYKRQFRQIIEKELDKNASIRQYFDSWGNRCYVFVDGVGWNEENRGQTIQHLELNTAALARMGGKYIMSANEIANFRDNGLVFEREFGGHGPFRKVYLYRVASSP